LIDWDLAVSTARTLMRPGPPVGREEAKQVARELVDLVPKAEQHVAEFTGLTIPDAHVPVAVVDRIGWVQANIGGFQIALSPLLEKLGDKSSKGLVRTVGSRITGVQVGSLMAYLGARVLGQFELFIPPGEGDGRLTLVAPNIVETERRLSVEPHDFRLWVVLHEVTHRTQFTAVPWLREHFQAEVRAYIDASDFDPAQMLSRIRDAVSAVRGAVTGGEGGSLLEALQTPEQRAIVARLQAMMSLLEGHGDYVMDNVGPAVVPSAPEIRKRFDERRKGSGPVDRIIRRLFGLDLKMRQYAEGEAFVRHVVDAAGMAGFNQVWTSPETLPTPDEIANPAAWLSRVSGQAEITEKPKPRRRAKKAVEGEAEDAGT
jgi:coenzyme F420 biosynthesis associated uncharacterized protein